MASEPQGSPPLPQAGAVELPAGASVEAPPAEGEGPDRVPEERGPAAYLSELLGTFALVFLITAVVSLYVLPPVAPQPGLPPVQPFIDFSVIGLVHVFTLFFLIMTLGSVSGAHFNPAVTLALTAIREVKPVDAAIYIAMQLVGAIAGAFLTKALLLDEGRANDYGATTVSDARLEGAILPGMALEAIGTFFLVFVIVGVAVNPQGAREWAGLTIGGTLGLLVMVLGPLTGAGINPARSFGPALASGDFGGADDFLLVYVLSPAVGAVAAAFVGLYLFIQPGRRSGGLQPVG